MPVISIMMRQQYCTIKINCNHWNVLVFVFVVFVFVLVNAQRFPHRSYPHKVQCHILVCDSNNRSMAGGRQRLCKVCKRWVILVFNTMKILVDLAISNADCTTSIITAQSCRTVYCCFKDQVWSALSGNATTGNATVTNTTLGNQCSAEW